MINNFEVYYETNISKSYFYDNEEKSNELETEYKMIDEYIWYVQQILWNRKDLNKFMNHWKIIILSPYK